MPTGMAAQLSHLLPPFDSVRSGFVRSGNYNWGDGALNNRGTNGNWWSSHTYEATNAHNLNTNSTWVNSQNGNNKGNGLTVRCVAW